MCAAWQRNVRGNKTNMRLCTPSVSKSKTDDVDLFRLIQPCVTIMSSHEKELRLRELVQFKYNTRRGDGCHHC